MQVARARVSLLPPLKASLIAPRLVVHLGCQAAMSGNVRQTMDRTDRHVRLHARLTWRCSPSDASGPQVPSDCLSIVVWLDIPKSE
jgi:hypothetical protein